ncbi:collagen alpha-1(III) chain-like [Ammospiza nelsoni]|uniref:collagen alpha-1(III) chain-like n=1 Tax=Ammospiza nelsoni TaxID=2857394 RepID=UPI002869CE2A|nr:collagen alpha-1(III) chain-like [Ammospiza nelsoni]
MPAAPRSAAAGRGPADSLPAAGQRRPLRRPHPPLSSPPTPVTELRGVAADLRGGEQAREVSGAGHSGPVPPRAPASARPTPRSALSSGERLRPRPRGGWITAAPRGPRVLGDGTWIYIRAGAASARARPFYLPKNKCAEINTPLQLGSPGSGGRRSEGEQSRSRAAAAGNPGPTSPSQLARVPPGTAGCTAVPTHPYPGSGTRLLPPLSAFVSPPPPARCGPAEGWAGEATAPGQPRPGADLPHPQGLPGGQGGGAGGALGALPPGRCEEKRRGYSPSVRRRGRPARALRPRPACHPTPGPPRPPPPPREPERRRARRCRRAGRCRRALAALRPALPATRLHPLLERPGPPRDGEPGGGARLGSCPFHALAHPGTAEGCRSALVAEKVRGAPRLAAPGGV